MTPHTKMRAADIRAIPGIVVSVRQAWGDGNGSWQESPANLIAESCTDVASPATPQARFTMEYGRIFEAGAADFSNVTAQDLTDQFVKIEVEDPFKTGTNGKPLRTAIFFGVFVGDVRKIAASQVDVMLATGDQGLTAFGLQHLLDRITLQDGFVSNDGLYEDKIGVAPVFNERFVRGMNKLGNSSKVKVFNDDATASSFLFSQDGELWNNRDIVEYLLAHYEPNGVVFELYGGESSQAAELANIIPTRLDLSGMTLKEALDKLIPRRRGLGWCIRVVEKDTDQGGTNSATKVYVHVFTVLDEDIWFGRSKSGGIIVGANKEIISTYDMSGLEVQQITQVLSKATAYGTIRVLGEAARAMFTLSFADGTLRKGWSAAQESAYKAVTGTADEADSERCTDKYAPVYQYFIIPDQWDWKAGDGAGGAKKIIPISFDKEGKPKWAIPSKIRKWGAARVFEDRLPIESKETEVLQDAPEYLAPFALIKGSGEFNRYFMCDKAGAIDMPNGHVSMLDNHAGIQLHYSPNHAIAKGSFDGGGATASNLPGPRLNFNDLVVTVSCRIDQRLEVTSTIVGNDPDRVLTIELPEAHFWYVIPGTVLGVTYGALAKHNPSSQSVWDSAFPAGNILRNDVDRLKWAAALAAVWYGRERSAVSFVMADIIVDLKVGNLLAQFADTGVTTEVHTVVSEKLYDLRKRITQISTDYAELDFIDR